jgi:hypothetical protein
MDQDLFNLNLIPVFSENLLTYKQSSSDSLELKEKDKIPYYEEQEQKDKFVESYQKVFNPYTADNKKDTIMEVHDIIDVDDFIVEFQKHLDYYYFGKDFDTIIEKIEKRFPFFFNDKTNGLLYIIQKLKFFELLIQDKLEEAKQFYKEKLIFLVKEIKKENWEKKNKFFMKLIKKPKLITKQGKILNKYYDQYSYELEKAIRNFFHENNEEEDNSKKDLPNFNGNSNSSLNHLFSSSSIEMDFSVKNKGSNSETGFNFKIKQSSEITKDTIKVNEEEKEDLDYENYSTKEEFSDFEDEIQQKCVDNQEPKEQNEENEENTINLNNYKSFDNKENIFNNSFEQDFKLSPIYDDSPDMSPPFMPFPDKSLKNSFSHIEEEEENIFIGNNKNEFIIDTSSKNLQNNLEEDKFNNNFNNFNANKEKTENQSKIHFEEINTNINVPKKQIEKKETKKYNKKKKSNKEETIFNQLPYLNSFKPKYIKRETIDKKIIRSFKNYTIKEYKANRLVIDEKTMDQNFFINFVNGNMIPPLDFHDVNTDEYVKFNSFNCSYLLWFFSKKGVKEVYNQFINEKGKEFTEDLSQYYEISNEEKNQLNSYIMNFPNIFDLSLVNSITQGATVKHLYRTVDKNKKFKERERRRKDDLDLRRQKSNESNLERCRSREFENSDNDDANK